MAQQQPLRCLVHQALGLLGRQGAASAGSGVLGSSSACRSSSAQFRRAVGSAAEAAAVASTSGRASTHGAAGLAGLKGLLQNYKQLSKFKLSSLVMLTASAGFVAASGDEIDYKKMFWTSLGTFGAAACANTLNQLYEITNDARMSRTCNRPLPTGRIGRLHAAAFAAIMGAGGLWLLHEKANPLTAYLGAANVVLYAGIYTPLKQLTVANTWVGAVVGAIPPLMGWASAAGQLDAGSSVLAAALFFWQMPHFLALAWMCKADYIAGGFRMLSGLDATGRRTAFAALRHCAYIAPIGLLAYLAGLTSQVFAWEAAALAAYLTLPCVAFLRAPSQASARKLFKTSLLYLPLLMLGLGVHRLPNDHSVDWETLQARVVACMPQAVQQASAEALGAVGSAVGSAAGALGDLVISSNIKCPSKAYGDSEERLGQQAQDQQEAERAAAVAAAAATAPTAAATGRDQR